MQHPDVRAVIEAAPARYSVIPPLLTLKRLLFEAGQMNTLDFVVGLIMVSELAGASEATSSDRFVTPVRSALKVLSDADLETALAEILAFRDALNGVASELANRGIRVEPDWSGDLAVLAQLFLARYESDWQNLLAGKITVAGPGKLSSDGRSMTNSDRVSTRDAALLEKWRESWRAPRRTIDLRATAAEGGRRSSRVRSGSDGSLKTRRAALRQVMIERPTLSKMPIRSCARELFQTWDTPDTAGGRLAELLGLSRPSVRTLERDLSKLKN